VDSGPRARLRRLVELRNAHEHPARAVARRIRWRLHWRLSPGRPFVVRHWCDGLSIALPRTGAGAQVYYQGFSSPAVAAILRDVLRPGESFIDVGAHVGEYSLLAASLVGPQGVVLAVEPQADLVDTIDANARRNGMTSLRTQRLALNDGSNRTLTMDPRTGGAWLTEAAPSDAADVRCRTFDQLLVDQGMHTLALAKIDAGGSETLVFAGAHATLTAERLPRMIYKLYHPTVVAARSGDETDVIAQITRWGYRQWLYDGGWRQVRDRQQALAHLGDEWYSVPVYATKDAGDVTVPGSTALPASG
jgi:FkbM family methyltransferase